MAGSCTRRPAAHFGSATIVIVAQSLHWSAETCRMSVSRARIWNWPRRTHCPHSRRLGYLVLSSLDFEAVVGNSDWPFGWTANTNINRPPIDLERQVRDLLLFFVCINTRTSTQNTCTDNGKTLFCSKTLMLLIVPNFW